MKIGIIIGIILGAVVLGVAIFAIIILGIMPISRDIASTNGNPVPGTVNYPVTSVITPGPATTSTTVPPLPKQTPLPNTTAVPFKDVNFRLNVANASISGITSAIVTAQLTNTGNGDAHNTWAKVEVYTQGGKIKVNGQDSLQVDLGTIQAGQTVTRNVEMDFSLFDGLKISQNGATLNLTIRSDEKTQSLAYEYHP